MQYTMTFAAHRRATRPWSFTFSSACTKVVRILVCMGFLQLLSTSADDDLKYLQFASVLFRHGDRSPVRAYPLDPFTESSWPQGFGQLTEEGIRHEYMLGQFLRQRYVDNGFLNATYINSKVYVRSTDRDRTLMSAYSVLAGLYPPQGDQEWNKNLSWQPIPVHTVPRDQDHLLYTNSKCPVADDVYNKWKASSPKIKKLAEENKELIEYVSNHTGFPNTLDGLILVLDPLFCEYHNGKFNNETMADWLKNGSTFWKLMGLRDTAASLGIPDVPNLAKLRGGVLVGELVNNLTSKSQKKPGQDIVLYSAHDSTVIALLSALKIFNYRQPPYCTAVFVELYEMSSKFVVKIFLKNGSDPQSSDYNTLHPLVLKGCPHACPLKKFSSIVKSVIVKDIRKACDLDGKQPGKPSADQVVGVAILSSIVILLSIILAAVCVMLCKRRHGPRSYRPLPTDFDDP